MTQADLSPQAMEAYWMPFTNNRQFKKTPRIISSAKGMYYSTPDGDTVLDGMATLWCVNAGHSRKPIVEAIQKQAAELGYASSFGMSHPLPFKVASRIAQLAPDTMNHVFFTSSGSESVDTALKIALAYHRLKKEGSRVRFIGRERAYHGVNIAGLSVAGLGPNRKAYGHAMLPGVDHLASTHDLSSRAFIRGCADQGEELADELQNRIVELHGADNIAAVIVEPVAGAGGVLVPPKGYLQRLRDICTKNGILLIFDEVITGFGRLGTPFAAEYFGVTPDLMTFAKGVTSATVPMGGVIVSDEIYDTFMNSSEAGIELFHGYTYSGHPLACAAALATLDVYEDEQLLSRGAGDIGAEFEQRLHAMAELPNVIDCRGLGLVGAVQLAPRDGNAGARAAEVAAKCWDAGVFIRSTGDSIAFCPPLIAESKHLDEMFSAAQTAIKAVA